VFIGGANPALRDDQPFSQAHFEAVCARFGDPSVLDKYDTVFVDSITRYAPCGDARPRSAGDR
jgi:hypothetical protein